MTVKTAPPICRAFEPEMTFDWATLRRSFQRFSTPMGAVHILRSYVPELSTDACEVRACVILDAKLKTYLKPMYKHKSTLSVCYQLTMREGSTGPSFQRIFYLKVFLGGRSTEVFHLLTHEGMSDFEFHDAVSHVPEQDLIVWRFPHDPALPHLRHLVDLKAVEQYLPVEGLRLIGMQGTAQVLAQHIVNYRPEIRCTNRYDLSDSAQDRPYQLFGKTFRDSEGKSLHEQLNYFWNRHLSDPTAMAVAQPLGYTAAVNTVWQRGISGRPLLEVLHASNYRHYIAAVAKGLASLHTSNVPGLAIHSPTDHLVEVRKKLTKLADAIPQLSETLGAIADDIEQTMPDPSGIPFHPIHWDFHIDQVLTDNGRLIFCDLDELVIGDPAQDLANFVVDLHFRHVDEELLHLITAELYRQYQTCVTWEVSVERLAWHVRLQLVNKAYRHYLRFAPDFEETVERIIRLAQRGLVL